jgi:hypothetical protein
MKNNQESHLHYLINPARLKIPRSTYNARIEILAFNPNSGGLFNGNLRGQGSSTWYKIPWIDKD